MLRAWASALNLTIMNSGSEPTFQRGASKSVIVLRWNATIAAPMIQDWKVRDKKTHRFHRHISFNVDLNDMPPRIYRPKGWNSRYIENSLLRRKLQHGWNLEDHTLSAGKLVEVLTKMCNAVLLRRYSKDRRVPVYWWNNEIAELRLRAHKIRRKYTRKRETLARTGEDPNNSERLLPNMQHSDKLL